MPKTHPVHRLGLILASVILTLVVLEFLLRLSGWIVLSWQTFRKTPQLEADVVRVLCLGESTTALPFEASYPKLLEQQLNSSGSSRQYQVINKGVSGYTTSDIRKHLKRNMRKYQPHIVILMMGVNDPLQFRKNNGLEPPAIVSSLRLYKLYRHLSLSFHSGFSNEYDALVDANTRSQELHQKGMKLVRSKDYRAAINAFMQSWESDRANYQPIMAWAGMQEALGNLLEAEEVFLKFLEVNPRHVQALYDLIEFYETHKMGDKLEQALMTRVDHHIFDPQAVQQLAQYYFKRGEVDRGNELLQRSHDIPRRQIVNELNELDDSHLYGDAVFRYYFSKYHQDPMAHRYFGLAATHFLKQGRQDLAQPYYQAAMNIRQQRKHPVTIENFQYIVDEVRTRNTRIVVMQYPLRRIEEIKETLGSLENVSFVENYQNFHEALSAVEYTDLFWDYFAGDFGHATREGNKLIAKNLARHILEWD